MDAQGLYLDAPAGIRHELVGFLRASLAPASSEFTRDRQTRRIALYRLVMGASWPPNAEEMAEIDSFAVKREPLETEVKRLGLSIQRRLANLPAPPPGWAGTYMLTAFAEGGRSVASTEFLWRRL